MLLSQMSSEDKKVMDAGSATGPATGLPDTLLCSVPQCGFWFCGFETDSGPSADV